MSSPSIVVVQQSGPNIVVRLLWFVFLGMWLGSIATCLGYLLCLTVVGLPLGLALLNRLPGIMTLRPVSPSVRLRTGKGGTVVAVGGARQRAFPVRAVYYLLIGWWLGGLVLALAWLLAALWWVPPGLFMLGAFGLFDRVPAAMTLRRT